MSKQAYYFPHFIGARNDSKILKLRRILGIEGYGIYFMILEVLREQSDFKYPISSIPELEFEFRVSKEKISSVIFDYELFVLDDENKFFSTKLIEYMQPYLEKSERAKTAALLRWNAKADANAYPKGEPNAYAINKEINKRKKEEDKEEIPPPLVQPFKDLETLKQNCLKDEIRFVAPLCAQFQISPVQLSAWMDNFHRLLQYEKKEMKQESDYRRHFGHWLKFPIQKNKDPAKWSLHGQHNQPQENTIVNPAFRPIK